MPHISGEVTVPPAADWPFLHPLVPPLPAGPLVIEVEGFHDAVVNHQTANTRLVTTSASYLLEVWLDAIGARDDVRLRWTADRETLARHAPEALARRGPWASPIVDLQFEKTGPRPSTAGSLLQRAIRAADPRERLALMVQALDHQRTAPALLAAASACMEVNDVAAAGRDLDEALAIAPDWAAAHFERGKLWLRVDDMERASESFRAAAARLPRFGAAWANLGATLGELDRPDEALAAFTRARECDPLSSQTINNIGVLNRELGNLAESEASFRKVIELSPDLAFGFYNLGHTLFLQGRYLAALGAYVEGQKRDSERNAVQATRLAMCRLATGDASGAIAELQRATGPLPREYRAQLLADTHTIAWALLTHRPDLPGWQQVSDWLTRARQEGQAR